MKYYRMSLLAIVFVALSAVGVLAQDSPAIWLVGDDVATLAKTAWPTASLLAAYDGAKLVDIKETVDKDAPVAAVDDGVIVILGGLSDRVDRGAFPEKTDADQLELHSALRKKYPKATVIRVTDGIMLEVAAKNPGTKNHLMSAAGYEELYREWIIPAMQLHGVIPYDQ